MKNISTRVGIPLLSFCAALCLPGSARTEVSAGGGFTTGSHYRGYEAHAGADLDKDAYWSVDAGYSVADSTGDALSRSRQVTLGLSHDLDDAWSSSLGLVGWRDVLNDVEYGGPSFGFSYEALRDDDEDGASSERFKASFNSELFALRANEVASARTFLIKRRKVVIAPQSGKVTLAQWHPSFGIEKPLGKGDLIPWISFGHFFYSKNPVLIEERAGRPRFSASANSLNGLVGGMPKNSGQAGLIVRLPWKTSLEGVLGSQQSATDNAWAVTQTVSLSQKGLRFLSVNLSWSRTIQSGKRQDLTTGGLTLSF